MPTLENFNAEIPQWGDSSVPIRGNDAASQVKPFPLIDAARNTQDAMALAQQGNQMADHDRARVDDQILQQELVNGADLATATGIKATADKLKGVISPAAYERLLGGAQAAEKNEMVKQKLYSAMPEEELANAMASRTLLTEDIGPVAQEYADAVKADPTKKDEALAEYQAKVAARLEAAKGKKGIDQNEVQALASDTPEKVLLKYQRNAVQQELLDAEAKRRKEAAVADKDTAEGEFYKAKAAGDVGTGVVALIDRKTGTIYRENANTGKAWKETPEGRKEIPFGSIPATAMKMSSTPPGGGVEADPDAVAYYTRMEQSGDLTWRNGLARSPEGRAIMVAVEKNRAREYYKEGGPAPEETATAHNSRTALAGALKDRTKFVAASNQFVTNFQAQADLVEKYLQPGSGGTTPVFNRWIQSGRKAVAGDEEVSMLDTAIRGLAREHQRIVTGVTSNAQLHASAAETADKLLNIDQSDAQIKGTIKVMREEATNANKAGKAEIEDLTHQLEHLGTRDAKEAARPVQKSSSSPPALLPPPPEAIARLKAHPEELEMFKKHFVYSGELEAQQ
jgi:hypothetical protein